MADIVPNCLYCNMRFSAKVCLDQHLASERHKKKVALHEGNPPVSSSSNLGSSMLHKEGPNIEPSFAKTDLRNGNNYYCEICCIICSGIEPYNQHIASAKHLKKAEIQKFMLSNSRGEPYSGPSSGAVNAMTEGKKLKDPVPATCEAICGSMFPYSCELCDKKFTGKETHHAHMVSKNHIKKEMIAKVQPLSSDIAHVSNTTLPNSDGSSSSSSIQGNVVYNVPDIIPVSMPPSFELIDEMDLNVKVFHPDEPIIFNI